MAHFCKHCGTTLNESARFCKGCGKAVAVPQAVQQQPSQQPRQAIYTPPTEPGSLADPSRGPVIFSLQSLKGAVKGIAELVKRPFALLPTLVIIVLQMALSFIKIGAPWNRMVTVLSFLTFAQGGMYGGVIGAAGGVIGRGIYTWAIGSLVAALFNSGKKSPKTPALKGNSHGTIPFIILGSGLGLFAYNFLTGDASIENALIGVTCAAACFRAAKRGQGYLTGLVSSFTGGKLKRGAVSRVILGIAAGMVFGTLTSLVFSGYWCYIIGAALTVIGLIISAGDRRAATGMAAFCMILSALLSFAEMDVNAADRIVLYHMSGQKSQYEIEQDGDHDIWLASSASSPSFMTAVQIDNADDIPISCEVQNYETPWEFWLPAVSFEGSDVGDETAVKVNVPQKHFKGKMTLNDNGDFAGTFISEPISYEISIAEAFERRTAVDITERNITYRDCMITVQIIVPKDSAEAIVNISYTADMSISAVEYVYTSAGVENYKDISDEDRQEINKMANLSIAVNFPNAPFDGNELGVTPGVTPGVAPGVTPSEPPDVIPRVTPGGPEAANNDVEDGGHPGEHADLIGTLAVNLLGTLSSILGTVGSFLGFTGNIQIASLNGIPDGVMGGLPDNGLGSEPGGKPDNRPGGLQPSDVPQPIKGKADQNHEAYGFGDKALDLSAEYVLPAVERSLEATIDTIHDYAKVAGIANPLLFAKSFTVRAVYKIGKNVSEACATDGVSFANVSRGLHKGAIDGLVGGLPFGDSLMEKLAINMGTESAKGTVNRSLKAIDQGVPSTQWGDEFREGLNEGAGLGFLKTVSKKIPYAGNFVYRLAVKPIYENYMKEIKKKGVVPATPLKLPSSAAPPVK